MTGSSHGRVARCIMTIWFHGLPKRHRTPISPPGKAMLVGGAAQVQPSKVQRTAHGNFRTTEAGTAEERDTPVEPRKRLLVRPQSNTRKPRTFLSNRRLYTAQLAPFLCIARGLLRKELIPPATWAFLFPKMYPGTCGAATAARVHGLQEETHRRTRQYQVTTLEWFTHLSPRDGSGSTRQEILASGQ